VQLPIADFGLGEAIVTVLMIFLIFIFIWVLVTILTDLFRDHELSGWAKAGWCFFLIFFPYITAFVYLIARGKGMRDRAIAQQVEMQQAADQYIRQVASSSPADEVAKLHDLLTKGAINQDEYERLKAKVA
jgi:hypothetical protein